MNLVVVQFVRPVTIQMTAGSNAWNVKVSEGLFN
jgi:hypothetical protein